MLLVEVSGCGLKGEEGGSVAGGAVVSSQGSGSLLQCVHVLLTAPWSSCGACPCPHRLLTEYGRLLRYTPVANMSLYHRYNMPIQQYLTEVRWWWWWERNESREWGRERAAQSSAAGGEGGPLLAW